MLFYILVSVLSFARSHDTLAGITRDDFEFNFANFIKHESSYLNVTTLVSHFVEGEEHCVKKCKDNNACLSINMAAQPNSNALHWCGLLSTDKYNESMKFISGNETSIHYSIQSPCAGGACLHGGTCYPSYRDGDFRCACPPLYAGKACQKSCSAPLGMEDGRIPDSLLQASSIWENRNDHSPAYGRLNMVHDPFSNNFGAWSAYSNQVGQYLQIGLGTLNIITGVGTQGRVPSNQWITRYTIQYLPEGSDVWNSYLENDVVKQFQGNSDGSTVVINTLDPYIKTTTVRIVAQAWHNYVSLRAELYGCTPP
ncbi:EGF-like repeat and discoidin I-like domain-containing protein 3 [Nematostella vectensis]|uniref:EGF-like repeat and discoidin I-like domain-containing protein 3 n=1 Tax=Nematostella vectensis TaxID=45351 RepID=UPI00207785FC|nr:EGF-like repeat and discoidin I-like domain-containing protein 3 [Nematostella vectensis]